jgi:hypothetical protein
MKFDLLSGNIETVHSAGEATAAKNAVSHITRLQDAQEDLSVVIFQESKWSSVAGADTLSQRQLLPSGHL